MLRRLDWPTCLKPSTSVQNLCDSSISRTLMTRWLMPAGVSASAGLSGTILLVPSAIVALRAIGISASIIWGCAAPCQSPGLSPVEPAPGEAEEALRHEDDHRDEHEPDRDQVVLGEKPRQPLPQQEEEGGADNRPDQGADAADDVVDDDFAGQHEEHEIRCGELVLPRVEHARQPGDQPRQ